MRRGRFGERHLAGLRIKASDVVGLFVGEPEKAIVVEDGRVGVDCALPDGRYSSMLPVLGSSLPT